MGAEGLARFDLYNIPTFEHAPGQWWMFATVDRPAIKAQLDDCRAAGAVLVEQETLELAVPGTSPHWRYELEFGRAIPACSHLMELVIAMGTARLCRAPA